MGRGGQTPRKVHPSAPPESHAFPPVYAPEFPPYPPYPPPNAPPPDYPHPSPRPPPPHVHAPGKPVAPSQPVPVPQQIGTRSARFDLKGNSSSKSDRVNPLLNTRRGCTDVLCCFFFILFIAGWGVIATIGFLWGSPERLIHPTDSQGRVCGVDRAGAYNLSSKPYLFYFDITKCLSYATVLGGCRTPEICVEKCPTELFAYLQLQAVDSSTFRQKVDKNVICLENVDKRTITNFSMLRGLVQNQSCAAYTMPSAAVLGRCVPEVIVGAADLVVQNGTQALDALITQYGDDGGILPNGTTVGNTSTVVGNVVNSETIITKIVSDLSRSWWQILVLLGAAGLAALIWTFIMRVLGGLMIWTSIIAIVILVGGGAGYCWYRYKILLDAGAINDYSFQPMIDVYFEMPNTWFIFAIIASVLLVIILLILVFIRSRIRIAVAMIEESSKAIGNMMSTLLFPLFPFVLHLLVFAIWGSIAIWLASTGQDNCRFVNATNGTADGTRCNCQLLGEFINVTRDDDRIFWLQAYNLFAFFWLTCFVTALGDISLAGAFASHYWAFNKPRDVPSFPVFRALGRALKYNLGSLAFGSLILAITKFIRVILDYLDSKLAASQNKVVKIIFLCLKCFFWCLEVFLKFLTKNAYIMMAIYGRNFLSSAKDSFLLLTRNIVRVVVLNRVTAFLLFLGKATITLGMGVVAFYYFSGKWVIDGLPRIDLYYYFVPIIIVLVGSYFIADLFFDVYEMAVDTTFICFLEDSEQNDGSAEKPFFMSPNLLSILGKKNEFPMEQAGR